MSQFQITIDTKRVCLLCLECTESGSNSDFTSFKIFLKYFKIDLGKILQSFPSLIKADRLDKNVGVILCHKCNSLMSDFLQWSENFGTAKLCLKSVAQSLFSVLKNSEVFQENLHCHNDDAETIPHFQAADSLRKEAIRKCSQKITLPKVEPEILNSQRLPNDVKLFNKNCSQLSSIKSDNQLIENSQAVEEGITEIDVVNSSEQPVASSSQIIPYPIDENSDFPNDDLPPSYPPGLESHYELQEEIFQTQLQKFPSGTTPQEVDDIIKAFLENDGKHPIDDPYRCTLPHGEIDLSTPFPTRIDFRVHMLFFHREAIETYLENLNVAQTNPPFEEEILEPVEPLENESNLENDTSTTITLREYLCFLCPQKNPFKFYSQAFRHSIMVHTFQHMLPWLPRQATENDLKNTIQGELYKARRIIQFDSVSKLLCPHCPAQFKQTTSLRYHILRTHLDKILTLMRKRYPSQRTIKRRRLQNLQIRRFLCPFCPKTFPAKQTLQLHKELVHTFLYFKPRLPRNSKNIEFLLSFEKLLEEGFISEEERRFGCPECTSRFIHKQSLKTHILRIHFDLICWEIEKNRFLAGNSLRLC